jgi:hypothetical protein
LLPLRYFTYVRKCWKHHKRLTATYVRKCWKVHQRLTEEKKKKKKKDGNYISLQVHITIIKSVFGFPKKTMEIIKNHSFFFEKNNFVKILFIQLCVWVVLDVILYPIFILFYWRVSVNHSLIFFFFFNKGLSNEKYALESMGVGVRVCIIYFFHQSGTVMPR